MKKLLVVFLFLIIFPVFAKNVLAKENNVNELGKEAVKESREEVRDQLKQLAGTPVLEITQQARRTLWQSLEDDDPLLLINFHNDKDGLQ